MLEEGTFVWGSGSQLEGEIETHWASSQPDNKMEGRDGEAHCVSFYKYVTKEGASLWDVDCSTKRDSVCEELAGESIIYFVYQGEDRSDCIQ